MPDLTIRIKSSYLSDFAVYYYTDDSYTKNNEQLNEYISLYKSNDNIRCLQIECDRDVTIDTIAYICNQVDENYFIRTDFSTNSKDKTHWLCFYKPEVEN